MLTPLTAILLSCLSLGASAERYVPGTPGMPWSPRELMIVKAKLRQLYHRSLKAPKALRLGFHDCLLYTDGSGGCDGCLNWANVDVKLNPQAHSRSLDDHVATDNNGLGSIVRDLEKIYTETNYPGRAPTLNMSLMDTGKSRADLWAYAAIVAVEFGIESNNIACDDQTDSRLLFGTGKGVCVHNNTEPGCKIFLPRAFEFKTGRIDCVETTDEPYKAAKHEHHPSYLANGRDTVKFMKEDFNFTGRETVAIFGAHTYGKPHFDVSQVPYTWTSRSINLFNNDYYKSMTGQDRWYFNENECHRIGDAFGNIPKSKWITHTRMTSKNGGPIFWIHHNHACPNCDVGDQSTSECCQVEPSSGMYCRADPVVGGKGSRDFGELDGDDNRGCERLRFISGADEIALNCEMGLYLDFEVDNGIIHGCPGLEIFNKTMTSNVNRTVWSTRADGRGKDQPGCPHQMLAEPAGSTPTYLIMEEYANDQDAWIRDFIPTMEKMLENGYTDGLLAPGPDHYTNITCNYDNGRWAGMYCYPNADLTSDYFMIASKWDQLEGKVMTMDKRKFNSRMLSKTGADNQLWSLDEANGLAINKATNRPLVVGANVFWEAKMQSDAYMVLNAETGQALDCWRARKGKPCSVSTQHGLPWQLFEIIPSM